MNPKVDLYFRNAMQWRREFEKLRRIILDCGLTEEFKWKNPCYTFPAGKAGRHESNIVLIHGFKEYCALWFFKGVLLSDSDCILTRQTENVQAARQIRFTDVQEIVEMETILKAYIFEAVEIEKTGMEVKMKKTSEFTIPEEFQKKLNEMTELETAFYKLTPGRQRGYILHFSSPKQSKTRETRIEKCIQKILNGKGLND
jgi:uncharacterized protein YdeI (YjbR/CyaY-like superfamily)